MSMFGPDNDLPPAEELSTDRLATLLCHRLLPGATSTTCYPKGTYRVPDSWLIAAHKAARRHRPQDDGQVHLRYSKYTAEEILGSLSVKLDFDLEAVKEAAENEEDRVILEALYTGLCDLRADHASGDEQWPGHC